MKPHHTPHTLSRLLLVLIAAIFLAGNLLAATSTSAVASAASKATTTLQSKKDAALTPMPQATPVPTQSMVAANTTGIIVFAIVIAVIVLVGTSLGMRRPQKKQSG